MEFRSYTASIRGLKTP